MNLSVAMREGAKLRPQGIGDFFTAVDKEDTERGWVVVVCSCALGAAWEVAAPSVPDTSVAHILRDAVEETIGQVFPEVEYHAVCPVASAGCCTTHRDVFAVVGHLNDYHTWTREQIADWLGTLGY